MKKILGILFCLLLMTGCLTISSYGNFFSDVFWKTATVSDVEFELMYGVGIDQCNEGGYTPLMFATANTTDPNVIYFMIENGAFVNAYVVSTAKNNPYLYNTDVYWEMFEIVYGTVMSANFWKTATVTSIDENIDGWMDINTEDKNGYTPLILASIFNRKPAVIEKIIERGGSIEHKTHEGKAAVDYAKDNPNIYNTDIYWAMYNLVYKDRPVGISKNNNFEQDTVVIETKNGIRENKLLLDEFWMTATLEDVAFEIQMGANVKGINEEGFSPIHLASLYVSDSEIIKKLINNGADVHTASETGITALMTASYLNENIEILEIFLELGVDINITDIYGATALMYACYKNSPDIIDFLLNNGATVKVRNINGTTPFYHAKNNNNLYNTDVYWKMHDIIYENLLSEEFWITASIAEVKKELDFVEDLNVLNDVGFFPLLYSSYYSDSVEPIDLLLQKGADINFNGLLGITALMGACSSNENVEIIEFLIEKGADINAVDTNEGKTPLMYACYDNPNVAVIENLISNGADIKARTSSGLTPLMCASLANRNSEIIELLIEEGADVNAHDTSGTTSLMFATVFNRNPDIVTILIQNGADINARCDSGFSALLFASKHAQLQIIQELINNGANLNARNENGMNAFWLACGHNKNPDVVNFFIEKGANVNDVFSDDLITVLMFACRTNSSLEVIQLLIQNGAEVNTRDAEGFTTLMQTCKHNLNANSQPEIIELLFKNGADIKATNNLGKSVLDIMEEHEDLYKTDIYWEIKDLMYE